MDSELKQLLKEKIQKVEAFSNSSKIKKWLKIPFRYTIAISFSKLVYPVTKRGFQAKAATFFDKKLSIILPSGIDIYLSGGIRMIQRYDLQSL